MYWYQVLRILPSIRHLLCQWREASQEMRRTFIPSWIVIQIQLVILFSVPPLTSREYFRLNVAFPPLLVNLSCDISRLLLLLRIVIKDCTSVLCPHVWALSVLRRGVVHLVEEFQQCAVRDFFGVEDDLEGFRVYCKSSA